MAITKIAGKFSVVLDSGVEFEITLSPWAARGKEIGLDQVGECFADRIQKSVDDISNSEVEKMTRKIGELELKVAKAHASVAEHEVKEIAAEVKKKKRSNIPSGFRDESTSQVAKRLPNKANQ